MTKTDNEKYVKRGADMFIEYNPEWEDEVSHANKGKVGAPYRYSETLIMLAAALRVGLGVQYRQLEGTIGKMIGESKTPSFSQLRKRMGKLDVSTDQGGVITVSDPKHSRILAADATGLKQHNRGEWMGKKWRVKRGFVKLHVMVDTQTMKIYRHVTEFRSLLGQKRIECGQKKRRPVPIPFKKLQNRASISGMGNIGTEFPGILHRTT